MGIVMITKAQAVSAREFHHDTQTQGTAGHPECYRVRRNGATQTWKTRPEWRIPVVHGLRGYGQIYDYDAGNWHTADQCPRDHALCAECGHSDPISGCPCDVCRCKDAGP